MTDVLSLLHFAADTIKEIFPGFVFCHDVRVDDKAALGVDDIISFYVLM